jgi:hypothetical protein
MLYDESGAYGALVEEACTALAIATPTKLASARLFSLAGAWIQCEVRSFAPRLWITSDSAQTEGGMSGSPIIDEQGRAIGMVCTSSSGPNPLLGECLPAWLLADLAVASKTAQV